MARAYVWRIAELWQKRWKIIFIQYSKVGRNNPIDCFYAMNFESQHIKGLSQSHTTTELHRIYF